jgi:hypothetical protein
LTVLIPRIIPQDRHVSFGSRDDIGQIQFYLTTRLKLSAASCGESSILKEQSFVIRSLTPQQARVFALATEFKYPEMFVRSSAEILGT